MITIEFGDNISASITLCVLFVSVAIVLRSRRR